MKFQWSIQPSHTQLVLRRVTISIVEMNIYDLPHKLDYIEIEAFHLASFLLIILIFTSLFEIDAWNFWYFNLMSRPLAFSTIHFKYMSFSLFLSQILICTMDFSAHYLFSRFDIGWAFKQKKKKSRKRYSDKSTHVSRSTKLLTNHSWRVWISIYNNHIDIKMIPIKIQVHREQAKLINAQSH